MASSSVGHTAGSFFLVEIGMVAAAVAAPTCWRTLSRAISVMEAWSARGEDVGIPDADSTWAGWDVERWRITDAACRPLVRRSVAVSGVGNKCQAGFLLARKRNATLENTRDRGKTAD